MAEGLAPGMLGPESYFASHDASFVFVTFVVDLPL
jgi:hypothetical protein